MTIHLTITRSAARFLLVAVVFAGAVVGVVAQTQVNRFPGKVIIESSDASSALSVTGGATFGGSTLAIGPNANPLLKFRESGVATDQGCWRAIVDGSTFGLQACDDAESTFNTVFSVGRTGAAVGAMTWGVSQHVTPGGSSAAPAYAFTGEADTGFYLTGTNSFGFASAGSRVGHYDASVGVWIFDSMIVEPASGGTVALQATSAGIVPFIADREADDGAVVNIAQDGVTEGSISVAGTTVSYNAFMGSHYTQTEPGQVPPVSGTVVVSTGRVIPSRVDGGDKFVYVRPSTKRNEAAVYGVWWASLNQTAKGMSWGDPSREVFQVAGLGLVPGVLVTDTCAAGARIPKGALIASSPRRGLAEMQCHPSGARYDPIVRDTTLGKLVVDVDFSKVAPDAAGVRKVLVPAVLYAG